eukprot:6606746-Prymnesium_polylepis.1
MADERLYAPPSSCTRAPSAISRLATARWRWRRASTRGVPPHRSSRSSLAPSRIKSFTASSCPSDAAECSAERPS